MSKYYLVRPRDQRDDDRSYAWEGTFFPVPVPSPPEPVWRVVGRVDLIDYATTYSLRGIDTQSHLLHTGRQLDEMGRVGQRIKWDRYSRAGCPYGENDEGCDRWSQERQDLSIVPLAPKKRYESPT